MSTPIVKKNYSTNKFHFKNRKEWEGLLSRSPFVIKIIEDQNMDMCIFAFSLNPMTFPYLKFINEDMVCFIAKKAPSLLSSHSLNFHLQSVALKINPLNLEFINDPFPFNILQALESDSESFQFIKNPTPEMCITALKMNPNILFDYIKNPTLDFYEKFLKENPNDFNFTIEEYYNIYMDIVRKKGALLRYIPMQSLAMCRVAFKQNIKSFQFADYKDDSMIKKAISYNPFYLKYVRKQSSSICKLAVSKNPFALRYVKKQKKSLCVKAIKQNPSVFRYIVNPSLSLQNLVLSLDGMTLKYIKDQSIYQILNAVSNNGLAIQYAEIVNIEIIKRAALQNAKALEYINFSDGKEFLRTTSFIFSEKKFFSFKFYKV